ncbi:hypothetical protein [Undibacterium sp. Ji22W]|uniref:hypothetical protein n=1 Tax=Undibacterium sp. Ji22W TaxID=3413038 RepID=UPI003BF3A078
MTSNIALDKFFSALRSADIEGMRSAVVGLKLNEYDEVGFTPLLTAVFIGDPTAVKILLEAGSDPNLSQKDDPSATPIWHAEVDFSLSQIADILREYGAVEFNTSFHTGPIRK